MSKFARKQVLKAAALTALAAGANAAEVMLEPRGRAMAANKDGEPALAHNPIHNGTYYVTTFAQTTGKTYIYRTGDIEKGPWKVTSFKPSLHDHSLFFDDDGRVYMLYGGGNLRLTELDAELSGAVRSQRSISARIQIP